MQPPRMATRMIPRAVESETNPMRQRGLLTSALADALGASSKYVRRGRARSHWALLVGCGLLLQTVTVAFADAPMNSDIEQLRSGTADQRSSAVISIGQHPSASAVEQLAQALFDEATLVRQAAAWALSQLGEAAAPARSQLTRALSDDDSKVRWGAAAALGKLGEHASLASDALVATTHDRDVDVRCAAIAALRTVPINGIDAAAKALCECLRDAVTDVRGEALATLSVCLPNWDHATTTQVVPSIVTSLADEDQAVRLAAAVLLSDLGLAAAPAIPKLASSTGDLDEHVRAAAIRALQHFADEIDRQGNLVDDQQRETVRRPCELATRALSDVGQNSAEAVRLANRFRQLVAGIQLTANEQPETVKSGLGASRFSQSTSRGLPAELPVSSDAADLSLNMNSNSLVRWFGCVLGILALSGLAWAMRRVFAGRLARKSVSADDRNDLRNLLSTTATEHSADADPIDAHVVTAVMASRLTQTLRDGPDDARRAAAMALGRLGLRAIDVVPQLAAALRDADPRVRAASAFALSSCGSHAHEAVPALRAALADTHAAVRCRAAFTLGQMGSAAKAAVNELARLVSDPDLSVRRNSASALGGIGSDAAEALPQLTRAAADIEVGLRRCAVAALGLIDPMAMEFTLRRALSDVDAEVRQYAQAALVSRPATSTVNTETSAAVSTSVTTARKPGDPTTTLKVFRPEDAEAADAGSPANAIPSPMAALQDADDAQAKVRTTARNALHRITEPLARVG